jgi:hypothetical protein
MAPKDTMKRQETPHPEKKKEEKLLDKSLEDSFPASDPSSVTRAPKEKRETAQPPAEGADRKPPVTPSHDQAESESHKNR